MRERIKLALENGPKYVLKRNFSQKISEHIITLGSLANDNGPHPNMMSSQEVQRRRTQKKEEYLLYLTKVKAEHDSDPNKVRKALFF